MGGSVFSVICEWVDPCTKSDPLAVTRLTRRNWQVGYATITYEARMGIL